jgi:NADH-quinone oxidoreductase subunit G
MGNVNNKLDKVNYFIVLIDNQYYEIINIVDLSVFQLCSLLNIEIPCFCYHEQLSVAGNCRMCLVEIANTNKLEVSCSYVISSNIKIFTNS